MLGLGIMAFVDILYGYPDLRLNTCLGVIWLSYNLASYPLFMPSCAKF